MRFMNRLKSATSPYLLQHADNPVDWWPWSPEAFAEARRRDVPVFLSVGYAACHWCHVMAHESFEDPAVAEAVNSRLVAIKVDREERPDIDAVYMSATQAMTGQGGWPMTVFMTPDGEPFYCGTYFPRAQFVQLVTAVSESWAKNKERISGESQRISAALAENAAALSGLGGAAGELNLEQVTAHGGGRPGVGLRRGQRRLRRGAEVPAFDGARVPAPPPRAHRRRGGALDGRGDLRGDGPRGHVRPARRRVRPVQRGRQLDRAALREDALRQRAAGRGLHPPVAADGVRPGPPGGRGDLRLHGPRAAHPRGRPVRLARRGQRRRRGRVLRLDPGRAPGGPRRGRRRVRGPGLRRHRAGHVRARRVRPPAPGRPARAPRTPGSSSTPRPPRARRPALAPTRRPFPASRPTSG